MAAEPSYKTHFEYDDHAGALECLSSYGYCVVRGVIGQGLVEELKDSIDEHLDPDRALPAAANRYHMAFAEVSEPVWKLIDHAPYWDFVCAVLGTADLCLNRSAAILRNPVEGMGTWHTDYLGHVKSGKIGANHLLNQFDVPSGLWFYLNGSDPERSGIGVIEKSHRPDWQPEGFEFNETKTNFHRVGEDAACADMDVPGCIAVGADPGDLICFADRTFHTNLATKERRYSCGLGFRPKAYRIEAPWPLPASAQRMIDRLPERLKTYVEGYTGYDGDWRQGE